MTTVKKISDKATKTTCKHCGEPTGLLDKFCKACGKRLLEKEEEAKVIEKEMTGKDLKTECKKTKPRTKKIS